LNKERVSSNIRVVLINFWAIFGIFYVFATQQSFLSPVQVLVNNELFHQSSFYLKNIVLSSLYFKNATCIFLRGL